MRRALAVVWHAWRWTVAEVCLCVALGTLAGALCWCAMGCGATAQRVQATAADAAAHTVNAAASTLLERYHAEGDVCIWQSDTRSAALECLTGVRKAWRPIWSSVEVFRVSHSTYATAVEAGRAPGLAELGAAYCAVRDAMRERLTLPIFGLGGCDPLPVYPADTPDGGQEGGAP
jgi:hypothetical protein